MLDRPDPKANQPAPIIVKKYANRRLYNTETSTYVTLEDLADMVRSDRDFVVQDAKSGDDLTHSVLTQIIVEQESRANGQSLLPIPFLRQLIRFYDDIGFGKIVPSYLQLSLETLTREQDRFRQQMAQSWGPGATFEAYREQARRNLEIFEHAMSMWTPQSMRPAGQSENAETTAGESGDAKKPASEGVTSAAVPSSAQEAGQAGLRTRKESPELSELRGQIEDMQKRLEQLAKGRSDNT